MRFGTILPIPQLVWGFLLKQDGVISNMMDNTKMDGANMRSVLLTVIGEGDGPGTLQSRSVLNTAANRLQILEDRQAQQCLMTFFHDLFRTGHLAWGYDVTNAGPPFFHITEQGRKALEHLSRDPMNPDGYLAYLSKQCNLGPIPLSYITEAVSTYNADCIKAAAVMVGCAAEAITIELRGKLVAKLTALSAAVPAKLSGWKVSEVLTSIGCVLDSKKSAMPQLLKESYEAFWLAFTGQIRLARNDAGHPKSIAPVTHETVHGSLLIFPEYAKLAGELGTWVTKEMN